ncbi:MAG: LptF/LptG family permease [Bacteroidota bacterium]|nr:LptF/LptG family permease [Bacteroidota bacterium]
MKIIDIYIIKKFLTTFVLIIGLFIIIAIVFDFSEKIEDFIKNQAPTKAILFDYYLNFIPYFVNLFSPLFVFISAIYFTSRLAYNTEIVAMLTNGMNFYRLLVPYFIVATILASFSFYLAGWAIPQGYKKLLNFEEKYILNPFQNEGHNIHRQVAKDQFIYIRNYHIDDNEGIKFSLEKFEGTKLTYKLIARRVVWVDSLQMWNAIRYSERTIDGMNEKIEKGENKLLNIAINPKDFGRKSRDIQTMNNKQLSKFIKLEKSRGADLIDLYLIEKYKRFSMPFATFILVLIAFTISTRKLRGGTGMHLGFGLMLAFTYILLLQFSTMIAIKTNFNPLLSVWLPTIIYSVFGVFLLFRAQK